MKKPANIELLIMTPEEFKDVPQPLMIEYSIFKTKFGTCLVASTPKGVCSILFADSKSETILDLKSRWPHARLISKSNYLHTQIREYFDTGILKTKIRLHVYGTSFQIQTWNALLTIRAGSTSTYGKVAQLLGDSKKSRAVGTAIGKNPIGYLIPCHRVIASSGKLGGYHWGIDRKRKMLEDEAMQIAKQ